MRVVVVAGILLALVAGGLHAQGVRDQAPRNANPQQREPMWRSMTPQQRPSMRQQMAPEQREALRNRMMEERRGAPMPGPPAAAPPGMRGGPHGPRRWSPEERQRFREQIIESTRDLRDGSQPPMRMERRKNRER